MAQKKMSRLISSLTHVRSLMSAASVNTARRLEPNPPDLIEWVRKEGGFVHQAVKVAVVEPYGLGLVASEEIPNGSDLIALPEHVPLKFGSVESEGKDGTFSVLVDLARQVPEEMWAMKLGLRLLQERAKKGSFWWPYISNLPETYNVPIFFDYAAINDLQYVPLLNQVNKRRQFLLNFWKEVKCILENLKSDDHPFGGEDVNINSLEWGMSAVSSRAFPLYGSKRLDDTYVDVPMMLPLIDMCNHSFDPNAEIVQEQETGNTNMIVKVVSKKRIKQEEALLLNYGCLNNDLFVLDYGFVIPSNPYDCIESKYDATLLGESCMLVGVASPNFSSQAPWQRQILLQLNLDGEGSQLKVTLGGPEIVDGRLLAAVRVLHATDMEAVQKHNIDTLKLLSVEAPLGKENEVAALRTIIALSKALLGRRTPGIMVDESLLEQDVSVSSELAIRYRIQKKSITNDVIRDLTGKVNLLLGPKPQKKKRKAKVPITG